MSTVNVIGLGYIGLPTSLALASHGVSVVGTDYKSGVGGNLEGRAYHFQGKRAG